jgi:hypothetical protein
MVEKGGVVEFVNGKVLLADFKLIHKSSNLLT